jgi:mannosyl-3-phosphoglycerate phosphatase family protein
MNLGRVVVSGIGGCLLDPVDGDYDAARPAVAALASLGVPLVLCSTRPRAEVELVSRLFGLRAPMIVENGAALVVPDGHLPHGVPGGRRDGDHYVLHLGPPRQRLREALAELAAAAGTEVRLVADLAPGDRPAGVGPVGVRSSLRHEHTDPFLVGSEEGAAALAREAEARGLRVARGERAFHLLAGADKGLALRTLLSLYAREGIRPRAVALGTWAVDLPMLRAAQQPVVMPGPGGRLEPQLVAGLRGAGRARRSGPAGWNDAVLDVLTGHRLPGVSAEDVRGGLGPRTADRERELAAHG